MIYLLIKKIYHRLAINKRKKYIFDLVQNGLRLGNNVEIISDFFFDPSHCFLISIGDNCTIAPGVRLIAHDASTKLFLGYTKVGKINIGENCFIGDSVIVLPSVNIGAGTIIGAGSVVTKDIPPGMVATGNPAKVICPVDVYLKKIEKISKKKTIFGTEYFIENIDNKKRDKMIKSIGDSIGFIV